MRGLLLFEDTPHRRDITPPWPALPTNVTKTKLLYLPAKSIPFVGLDGRGVAHWSNTARRPGWSLNPGSTLYTPDPNDAQWQTPRDSELNAHPIYGYLFHQDTDHPTEHLRSGYHLRLAHVLANIMAPLTSPTAESPAIGPTAISLSLRHQTYIGVPPDYDPLYEYRRAAYQPTTHLPHSVVQATPDLRALQSLHLTDTYRLSLPDYIPPTALVQHLEEALLASRPNAEANSYCALSMEVASHAESITRRRLAAGVNCLRAQVDHLSGLLHTDPPTMDPTPALELLTKRNREKRMEVQAETHRQTYETKNQRSNHHMKHK